MKVDNHFAIFLTALKCLQRLKDWDIQSLLCCFPNFSEMLQFFERLVPPQVILFLKSVLSRFVHRNLAIREEYHHLECITSCLIGRSSGSVPE